MKQVWGILLVCVFALMAAGCSAATETSQPLTAEADSYKATLEIAPGIVGENTYKVTIADQSNQAQSSGKAVLHFSMGQHGHGSSQEELVMQPDSTWTGEGPHLMMPGAWELALDWQDDKGVRHVFTYTYELNE